MNLLLTVTAPKTAYRYSVKAELSPSEEFSVIALKTDADKIRCIWQPLSRIGQTENKCPKFWCDEVIVRRSEHNCQDFIWNVEAGNMFSSVDKTAVAECWNFCLISIESREMTQMMTQNEITSSIAILSGWADRDSLRTSRRSSTTMLNWAPCSILPEIPSQTWSLCSRSRGNHLWIWIPR